MGNLENVNVDFSLEDVELAARKCEPLKSIAYGYDTIENNLPEFEDYKLVWINTQGIGNHGSIIVTGKTPKGKKIVRSGRIAKLVSEGCLLAVAKAATRVKFGMETHVWQTAQKFVQKAHYTDLVDALGCSSHYKIQKTINCDYDLSFGRVRSAIEIAIQAQLTK